MSFRPLQALAIGIVPILGGCYLLLKARSYSNIAVREAVAVGKITHVFHDDGAKAGPIYEYVFLSNDVEISNQSRPCKTPLTLKGCNVGGLVRVYYDPNDPSNIRLQEFGDASREDLISGTLITGAGLIFVGANYLLRRTEKDSDDSDDSDDPDESGTDQQSGVLHIVPGKESN